MAGRWEDAGVVRGFSTAAPNEVLLEFVRTELAREPGLRVLDLGCGAARNAAPMAAEGATVIGIDVASPMLEAGAPAGGGRGPGPPGRPPPRADGPPAIAGRERRSRRRSRGLEPGAVRGRAPPRDRRGGAGRPAGRGPLRLHVLPRHAPARRRAGARGDLRVHPVRGRAPVLPDRGGARRTSSSAPGSRRTRRGRSPSTTARCPGAPSPAAAP